MIDADVEIRAYHSPSRRSLDLYIWLDPSHGIVRSIQQIVTDVVSQEIVDGTEPLKPSLRISEAAAQSLVDQLWQSGFRPTLSTNTEGELAATKRHLQDMRAIASKHVKVQLP